MNRTAEPASQALFDAIKRNDLEALNVAIQACPEVVNTPDADDWTPLQMAVMYGCNLRSQKTRPTVERLIEAGASFGLAEAAIIADATRLSALLNEGGNELNKTDQRGWTALHWACEVGSFDCTRLLLDSGADPNVPSRDGTPMERAAHPGPCKPTASSECIALLRDQGATITAPMAAMIGDANTLRALLDSRPQRLEEPDQNGATPLWQAAHNLHLECVNLLIDRGANANALGPNDKSVIGTAVDHVWDKGGPEVAARLMQEDPQLDFWTAAQVDAVDSIRPLIEDDPNRANAEQWGCSVLYLASGAGAADIVRLLLEHGADPNFIRSHNHDRPIHNAIFQRKVGVVKVLLEGDADPNALNALGNTPLHSVVYVDSAEFVRLLLDAGADTTIKNKNGHTPLEMAIELKRTQIQSLLEAPAT